MSVEPTQERMDPQAVLYQALVEAGVDVVGDTTARLDPTDTPVTVVKVTNTVPMGRLTRWVYTCQVSLVTYASGSGSAWHSHTGVADALLRLSDVLDETIRVSGVVCTQEPVAIDSAVAPQWPGMVSLYSLTLRRN